MPAHGIGGDKSDPTAPSLTSWILSFGLKSYGSMSEWKVGIRVSLCDPAASAKILHVVAASVPCFIGGL